MKLISSEGLEIIPYREKLSPGWKIGEQKTAVFIPKKCLTNITKEEMKLPEFKFSRNDKLAFISDYAAFFCARFCKDRKFVPDHTKLISRIANKYVVCTDLTVFSGILLEYTKSLEEDIAEVQSEM